LSHPLTIQPYAKIPSFVKLNRRKSKGEVDYPKCLLIFGKKWFILGNFWSKSAHFNEFLPIFDNFHTCALLPLSSFILRTYKNFSQKS